MLSEILCFLGERKVALRGLYLSHFKSRMVFYSFIIMNDKILDA